MEEITITVSEIPSQGDLVRLYSSVGWSRYTADPNRLSEAIINSLRVVCARDGELLVGLARVVGDGVSIIYLQDILVDPRYQRLGLGRRLMQTVLEPYGDVRQQVLLTDDGPGHRAFYQGFGFTEVRDFNEWPLRVFVRFQ